jgi:hypothetical protein
MPSRKFHVGEAVILSHSIRRNAASGVYEVTGELPENGGEFEYRIKSAIERHERVARESDMTKA